MPEHNRALPELANQTGWPVTELADSPLPFTAANVDSSFGAKPAINTGGQAPWRRAQESDKCRDGTMMQVAIGH